LSLETGFIVIQKAQTGGFSIILDHY